MKLKFFPLTLHRNPEQTVLPKLFQYVAALRMAASKTTDAKEAAELRQKLTDAERLYNDSKKAFHDGMHPMEKNNAMLQETNAGRFRSFEASQKAALLGFDLEALKMQIRSSERFLLDEPVKTQEQIIAEAVKAGVEKELPLAMAREAKKKAEAEAIRQKIAELKNKPGASETAKADVEAEESRNQEIKSLQTQLAHLEA